MSFYSPEQLAHMPPKWRRYFLQPSGTPDRYPAPVSYCINPPSHRAPTEKWQRFRADMAARAEARPDDPNFAAIVETVDALLAWREAVPVDERFWQPYGLPAPSEGLT